MLFNFRFILPLSPTTFRCPNVIKTVEKSCSSKDKVYFEITINFLEKLRTLAHATQPWTNSEAAPQGPEFGKSPHWTGHVFSNESSHEVDPPAHPRTSHGHGGDVSYGCTMIMLGTADKSESQW